MEPFRVEFFQKRDGKEPAKDFLESLDTKMLAKMTRTISVLQENGPALREPYSKPIEDGIFELRAKIGSDITRVLYFFFVGHRIILTNGFIKKTQKTPRTEIDKAKEFRKEFLESEEL